MGFYVTASGTRPYKLIAKNFQGDVVHSIEESFSDEMEIPALTMANLIGGLEVTITDSQNQYGTQRWDNATLGFMKIAHVGFSVANGDIDDHVEKIQQGQDAGYTFTSVVFDCNNFVNDAQLIAFENLGPFDHTASLPSTPVFPFDRTVHKAKQMSTCKYLLVNLNIVRELRYANNGTDRNLFMSLTDSQMRPDGTTPTRRPDGTFLDFIIPSYSSPAALAFAKRFTAAFYKRYLPAINDGTIQGTAIVTTDNAEGEQLFFYKLGDGVVESVLGDTRSHGDFHPAGVAKFKLRFNIYNTLANTNIALASQSTDLGKAWRWHNNQTIIDFEVEVGNHVRATVTGLTRSKYLMVHTGSALDGLALFRSAQNLAQRVIANKYVSVVKTNDSSAEGTGTVLFYLDVYSTMARDAGAYFIAEPSPPAPYDSTEHMANTAYEMIQLFAVGAGVSFFTSIPSVAAQLMAQSGITPGGVPTNKNEYQISGSDKHLLRHSVNLSDVIAGGGFGFWKTSYEAFKTANSLTRVSSRSVDNLKSNVSV